MTIAPRAINKPLTLLGADRIMCLLAFLAGAGMFITYTSFKGGMIMFLLFWFLGRVKAKDPTTLRLLFNAGRVRTQYSPAIIRPFHFVVRRETVNNP